MKKSIVLVAITSGLFAASASANIKWDYLGVGYTDVGPDGAYVEGSFRLNQHWAFNADYARLSEGPADYNKYKVGVKYLLGGTKFDSSANTQPYLTAGYERIARDARETGGYAGIGFKHALTPEVEVYTEATYHNIADSHGSLAGGIAYYLNSSWAIRSDFAVNSGNANNAFRFGISYQF